MSELAQSVDLAYKKAEELNLNVVVPDEYTLQLDYDSNELPTRFDELLCLITTNLDGEIVPIYTWNYSKSGNIHAYVTLKNPITACERIALQAALGSDPKREILSLARLKRGEVTPTLLFEVKKPEISTTVTGQTGFERL